jgi:NAD(P)-dependent dehydrogenase (short-subunit alcohol dehydrogenase family)
VRDLVGKTALITGAASGIGRATAHALAKEGMKLVVCDVDEAGLSSLSAELGDAIVLSRRVDVADRAQMIAVADAVHADLPALDVLVNNAGVGLAGGVAQTSLDDWDWIVGVNLMGAVHGNALFVPKMIERKAGGHVVNVASALGYFGAPYVLAYATTKAAVMGMSESLRAELAPKGIGVSVICPGIVQTGIIGSMRFPANEPDRVTKSRAKIEGLYAKRGYGPEGVAAAIVSAIRWDRAIVPVTVEAWALFAMKRFAPGLSAPVGRWMAGRLGAPKG